MINNIKFIQFTLKLSAVRKVLETKLFLAHGGFGTLGPKLSHGTSLKFADVRTHLRKVSRITLSSILASQMECFFCFCFLIVFPLAVVPRVEMIR